MRRAVRACLGSRHAIPIRVGAWLLLLTVWVATLSPPTESAAATDPGAQSADQARAAAVERVAAVQRVAAAVRVGEQARAAVDTARRERVERAARDAVRSALPGCDTLAPATTFPNGRWPESALCGLPGGGHFLRPDAAAGYVRLSFFYAQVFGGSPCLTDSYRSLAGQRSVAARKPRLAARAGTSSHGEGVAVDLCGGAEVYGTAQHTWLRENGPRFGWDNPEWARAEGARPEPWHWEYSG